MSENISYNRSNCHKSLCMHSSLRSQLPATWNGNKNVTFYLKKHNITLYANYRNKAVACCVSNELNDLRRKVTRNFARTLEYKSNKETKKTE